MIYNFYDKLARIFDSNPDLHPDNIWNCNEPEFPTDPGKSKVITTCNKSAFKLSYGACRGNTTTLVIYNATETVLDLLIFYRVAVNGWIETNAFADWFDAFAEKNIGCPMLLLFDGHMTHISIHAIQQALLKFLTHVTDIFQLLDKYCFGPLVGLWGDKLNALIIDFSLTKKVDKTEFVNLILSIWHIGIKESNVIAGFETADIWPLNKEKHDKAHFLFEKY